MASKWLWCILAGFLLYFTGSWFLVMLTYFDIYIDLTAVRKSTLHISFHYLCTRYTY